MRANLKVRLSRLEKKHPPTGRVTVVFAGLNAEEEATFEDRVNRALAEAGPCDLVVPVRFARQDDAAGHPSAIMNLADAFPCVLGYTLRYVRDLVHEALPELAVPPTQEELESGEVDSDVRVRWAFSKSPNPIPLDDPLVIDRPGLHETIRIGIL